MRRMTALKKQCLSTRRRKPLPLSVPASLVPRQLLLQALLLSLGRDYPATAGAVVTVML